ncbi:hypothetical protein BS47DRAFT_1391614 [Hydnum rufescens UP504]|uniref:Uncharacterized protein n=1 Tax=Hydnum rufescens UP504 TaxID=1448309 RepID=A0A9P6B0V8_9AGAM|nr:hypothetical protein BS47DRAFT_1391614 [Hydnum rufescens UP504]
MSSRMYIHSFFLQYSTLNAPLFATLAPLRHQSQPWMPAIIRYHSFSLTLHIRWLGSLYIEWYTLVVGPLPKGAERERWLEEFAPYGCLGVRQTQQKKHRGFRTWSMCLAFKSRRHLGMVYNTLTSQAEIRGLSQFQIKDVFMEMVSYIWLFEPRYIEHAIAYHRSQSDLQEMVKMRKMCQYAFSSNEGIEGRS